MMEKGPHATAHKIHVHNELKMLKRFGNFIMKYEGTFKERTMSYLFWSMLSMTSLRDVGHNHFVGTLRKLTLIEGCFPALRNLYLNNNFLTGGVPAQLANLTNLEIVFNGLVDHFKMALDCFFAVWFVVGNVWIFGGHSSPSDAPKLYRLCIAFLTFSCIGYAMPFILCATICCCLPCIISILGFREDLSQTRGATPESINALPTYKFKLKKTGNGADQEANSGGGEGGVLAAGTEKERTISGEDAVCCICLAKYADNDELRELPCSHLFHTECVDKWLKINALCPLCKCEVGEGGGGDSPSPSNSSRHLGERSG